jgi:predicted transcriptional regulator YdeE
MHPEKKQCGLTSGLSNMSGMDDLAFKLEKMPEFTVVGVTRRTCNADGRSIQDIPAVWRDFLTKNAAAQIKNRAVPPVMYAVYSDYEKDWTKEYNFLIGCGVTRAPTVPEGMTVRRIPAQTYAHFVAKGEMPQSLLEVWSGVWLSTLPRTYTFDFEVYDQRFTRPRDKEIDVYVAVDPKKIKESKK